MNQVRRHRNHRTSLFGPPPSDRFDDEWSAAIVDLAEQLEELSDLRSRELLTADEFEQQRARILGR